LRSMKAYFTSSSARSRRTPSRALRRDADDGRSRVVDLTAASRAKLAEANRLWRKAQRRFEEVNGEERAAALRVALAEIYSDEFAEAFGQP
jgi:hypothetical protein